MAEHGGFTAAAQAVFVSQPALSLAIKELEAEVGTSLFTRTSRHVTLTAAGQALLGPAKQVIRDLDTGQAAIDAITGLTAGHVTLACLPTLVADPVAPLVGAFRRHYPGVRVDLAAPDDTGDLLAMVASGSTELGVTEAHDIPPDLSAHPLGRQSLVLILPPGTDRLDNATIDLAELEGEPFIVVPPGTSSSRLLAEAFASAGIAPTVAVVTAQRDAILPLVIAGAGVALVPETLAATAQRQGAVRAQPTPPITRDLVLVHRGGTLSPAAREFTRMATS